MSAIDKYKVGDTFKCDYRQLRIMAIKEGYLMVRYKGCVPFVKDYNQFEALLIQQNATKF